MQDFVYSEWSQPHYEQLCRSRTRSPLKIQGAVEEKGRIDSVTNVHRKYLLYSSESRCVHLFQEKVTRYVKPVRRYRPEIVRSRNTECTVYSPPTAPRWMQDSEPKKWVQNSEPKRWVQDIEPRREKPAERPVSQERLYPRGYYDLNSTKTRSCHSFLNADISPDFTSPRFVRPCKMNKRMNVKFEEEGRKKLALEMKPHCNTELIMDTPPANYVEELKHLVKHYLSEKSGDRLECSTLHMDVLSLIMSTISPYLKRIIYVLWRVKCLADKALRSCLDYNVIVK